MSVPKLNLRKKRKKSKKNPEDKWDWLEILFWIPEIILYPIRLLWWVIRGAARMLGEALDFLN